VISTTRRPLYSREDPVPIVQKARWASRPVWMGMENLAPTRIRFSKRPARSESLHRLRYPGHILYIYIYIFIYIYIYILVSDFKQNLNGKTALQHPITWKALQHFLKCYTNVKWRISRNAQAHGEANRYTVKYFCLRKRKTAFETSQRACYKCSIVFFYSNSLGSQASD
jgi:hypothetical protein